jgi:hypothetical protein
MVLGLSWCDDKKQVPVAGIDKGPVIILTKIRIAETKIFGFLNLIINEHLLVSLGHHYLYLLSN